MVKEDAFAHGTLIDVKTGAFFRINQLIQFESNAFRSIKNLECFEMNCLRLAPPGPNIVWGFEKTIHVFMVSGFSQLTSLQELLGLEPFSQLSEVEMRLHAEQRRKLWQPRILRWWRCYMF